METLYHQVCSSLLCLRPSAHREPALHLQSSPFSLVIPLPLSMLLPQGGVKGTQRAQTKQDMLSNGGSVDACFPALLGSLPRLDHPALSQPASPGRSGFHHGLVSPLMHSTCGCHAKTFSDRKGHA